MPPAIAAPTVNTSQINSKTVNPMMAFTATSFPSLALRHVAS
jgi:hypothetical protein